MQRLTPLQHQTLLMSTMVACRKNLPRPKGGSRKKKTKKLQWHNKKQNQENKKKKLCRIQLHERAVVKMYPLSLVPKLTLRTSY